MAKKRILVSWIGHTDLLSMAADLPAGKQKKVLETIRKDLPARKELGPIRTLVDQVEFDEIHLLTTDEPWISQAFAKWLGQSAKIHTVEIAKPTDYPSIFSAADQVLSEVTGSRKPHTQELCIHLSPGAPAMAAVSVLLGKSRYPATFYQTYDGKAWETEIPFDLIVDYVPELLRAPDGSFQHLAARTPQEIAGFEDIVGQSQAIRLAVGRAQKAAIRDVPVLILGESGTGKEMFARAIHAASHRKKGPFIAINCAAIPTELLGSELFGHVKGAFTGAERDRTGRFEEADGGTLFMDEVGECSPEMQTKLLRALQPPPGKGPCHRVFQRLGETRERTSNVRIVAATNRDLLGEVRANNFREDLYYRLAVITLKLPALRDRQTDIPLLVDALLEQINREFAETEPGYQPKSLSKAALNFAKKHPWRGNVRQLHNALVQAAVMCDSDTLKPADLAAATAEHDAAESQDVMNVPIGDGFCLKDHQDQIQRHFLTRAMEDAGGVLKKAADLLGMDNYQTLAEQLKRLDIDRNRWKE